MTPEERNYLHHLWFNEGWVSIDLLSDWGDRRKTELLHFFVETHITNDFQEFFGCPPVACSYGKNPWYDVELQDKKKVEIKISSHEGNVVFVETERLIQGNWEIAGLLNSEADWYIFLQPGVVIKDQPVAMKVRIIKTSILKQLNDIYKTQLLEDTTKGFYLDFGLLANDGWVGSYEYNSELKQFNILSPTRAFQNIKKIKEN